MRMPTLDAVKMGKSITLTVRVRRVREAAVRWHIAAWLIRVAAWIANFNLEFVDEGRCE